MSARFTIDGSEALEARLADLCTQAREGVRRVIPDGALAGLALGGGYGRGEGGVLRGAAVDEPYNDLEFYVFFNGPALWVERRHRARLESLGHRLSEGAGVEMEFKGLGLGRFRRSATTMFYYDLVLGHRWLIGDDALFDGCDQHRDSSRIPAHEATRLLMNRCSGLLFAAERLRRPDWTSESADFVGRNLAKAELAFGDAVLASLGGYHWSCLERNRRVGQLPPDAAPHVLQIRHWHARGVDFKLHPRRSAEGRLTLSARLGELTEAGRDLWLWAESRRLGRPFSSIDNYIKDTADKCPETRAWRNRLVTARAMGAAALFKPGAERYPRQRLFHSLALLLWTPGATDNPQLAATLRSQLGISAVGFSGWVAAYQRLWSRFN